jgi:chromate transport protein ChrA
MGGWTTAAVCTAAFLLPSMLLMLLLAHGYGQVAGLPGVAAVRRGVLAAVVGLLILTMARLGLPILIGPLPVGLALAAFAVAAFGQANGVWIVLAAGVIGALLRRR